MGWAAHTPPGQQREWVVERGGTEPKLFRWRETAGPVDLTAVGIVLRITWPAGAITLTEADPEIVKWDQTVAVMKGFFAITLSPAHRALLPIDFPARWEVALTRFGITRIPWRGAMPVLKGLAPDV